MPLEGESKGSLRGGSAALAFGFDSPAMCNNPNKSSGHVMTQGTVPSCTGIRNQRRKQAPPALHLPATLNVDCQLPTCSSPLSPSLGSQAQLLMSTTSSHFLASTVPSPSRSTSTRPATAQSERSKARTGGASTPGGRGNGSGSKTGGSEYESSCIVAIIEGKGQSGRRS
jgi:hypothetical protein